MMCGDIRRVVHWSDVEAVVGGDGTTLERESWRRRTRTSRAAILSRLLRASHVRVSDDWASGSYLIHGPTGETVVVEDLESVWSTLRRWGIAVPDPASLQVENAFREVRG